MNKYFSIIILLMFSIALTACGGGGGGAQRGAVFSDNSSGSGGGINTDDDVTLLPIEFKNTVGAPSVVTPYDSLTEASDAGDGSQDFTLKGSVVQGSVITNYTVGDDSFGWTRNSETILNVSRIILPAVSVRFDGEGRMSAVTAYFADQNYTPVIGRNTPLSDFNLNGELSGDYDSATLIVDRSKAFFGYDANYMTHIGWRVEQDVRDYIGTNSDILEYSSITIGSMIAGIETRADTLPNSNENITFMGRGHGYYSEATGDAGDVVVNISETEFAVSAIVNFGSKSLTVRSSGSCEFSQGSNGCEANSKLDFSTPKLFYTIDSANNKVADISGTVALNSDASVAGVFDAQFYGIYAREFGGTFAMRGQTSDVYYYGAFGAERKVGIKSPVDFSRNIVDVSVSQPHDGSAPNNMSGVPYQTISAVARDKSYKGADRVFTLKGVTVYRDDRTDYVRAPYRGWDVADTEQTVSMVQLAGAATSLTFDRAGNISGVTAHLNNNDYTADSFNAVSDTVVFAPITQGAGDASVARLVVDRSANLFGFNAPSNYMAYVSWNLAKGEDDLSATRNVLTDSIFDIGGNMIVGIETSYSELNALPKTQTEFRGRGQGSYSDSSTDKQYQTVFDVVANVDFSDFTIALDVNNTDGSYCEALDCVVSPLAVLDFKTELKYATASNSFLATEDLGQLSGRVDSHFYGASAEEFGGSFIFTGSNVDDYYYGAFGTGRAEIFAPIVFATNIYIDILGYEIETAINNRVAHNPVDYPSLSAAAETKSQSETLTLNALASYQHDVFTYKRGKDVGWDTAVITPKVYLATILNPAASLTFDEDGDISRATIYLANQTHRAELSGAASDVSSATNFSGTDGDVTVTVDRSNDFFGLTAGAPNYMAYLGWDLSNQANLDNSSSALEEKSDSISGSMLAGLQTDAADIPNGITSETVAFSGKGRGAYGSFVVENGEATAYNTVSTTFDVTANVDFNSQTVMVKSTGTKEYNATDTGNAKGELDFTTGEQAIRYFGNNFSSTVSAGNLTGRLDARFYGGAAREFGGTFAMLNVVKNADDSLSYADTSSYYGVFGTERLTGVETNFVFDADIKDEVAVESETVFDMAGLSVYQDSRTVYTRAPNRAWSTNDSARNASITRLDGGGLSITSGTVYADNVYTDLTIDRSDTFGFTSNYMAYVNWESGQTANITTSNTLEETGDSRNGMMLAGIETTNDMIPLTNGNVANIDFTGKGRGVYVDSSDDSSYKTIFDVTAEVDFASNTVSISSSKSCKDSDGAKCADGGGAEGADRLDSLNFSTGDLSYRGNNISGVANAGTLAGTLDARFYGGSAREFGGRFALSDAVNAGYYYGVFGAERGGINILEFDASINNARFNLAKRADIGSKFEANDKKYTSLTALAEANGSRIMRGSSAYQDNSKIYTRVLLNQAWSTADTVQTASITRLSESAASLTFNNGNISAVTTYLNGVNYTATGTGTAETFTGTSDTGFTLTVDRKNIFGFDSNYMAAINWERKQQNVTGATPSDNLKDSDYNISGNMLVGLETVYSTILTTRTLEFTGKGRGFYTDVNNKDASYETIFDVIANVDFSSRTASISSSNSCKADNCTANPLNTLNFTTASLSYTDNNISGAVTAGSLVGTLDARFYGTVTAVGTAEELGGTFALVNSSSYYYGAFGAQYINNFIPRNTTNFGAVTSVVAINPQTTSVGYVSLGGVADANVTLQGLAVSLSDITDYARDKDDAWSVDASQLKIDRNIRALRVTSAAATLAFASDGSISGATVYADDDYNNATVDRNAIFGFDSEYMAYVTWGANESLDNSNTALTQSVADSDGMMIAGIETADLTPLSANGVVFKGKGKGFYDNDVTDVADGYETIFDVTATVDFGATKSIVIGTSGTTGTNGSDLDANNFATITDFSTLTATANAGTLSGTLDARFYGGVAQELGGTFALTNNDSYYYGAFGAKRNYAASLDAPKTFTSLTGFNDSNRASETGVVLKVNNAMQATDDTINDSVTIEKITGAVVEFDYNADGDFAATGLTLYLADKKYSVANATANSDSIKDALPIANGENVAPSYFSLTKEETYLGFAPNYMAAIWWTLTETGSDSYGFAIAGYETKGNEILTEDTIRFTGEGRGLYRSDTEKGERNFYLTADVDFATRSIDVTALHSLDNIPLDFTGNLSYASGSNIITGNIGTAGDDEDFNALDGTELSGTADAKFYGPVAQEFGGTFALSNSGTTYYYGAFGATSVVSDGGDATPTPPVVTPPVVIPTTGAPALDTLSYASFDAVASGAVNDVVSKTIHLDGVAVLAQENLSYTRSDTSVGWTSDDFESSMVNVSRITAPVVSLTYDYYQYTDFEDYTYIYDEARNEYIYNEQIGYDEDTDTPIYEENILDTVANPISSDDIFTDSHLATASLYVGDKAYTANTSNVGSYRPSASFYGDIIGVTDANKNIYLNQNFNGPNAYFNANYMVNISWDIGEELSDTATTDIASGDSGYMVAGFETAGGAITGSGTVTFNGIGRGGYVTTSDIRYPNFNVTANVDFSARTVALETTDTQYYDYGDCTNVCYPDVVVRDDLNFTSTLSYAATTNNISGTVAADGMSGTADARFYGAAAEEFGGTFYMNAGDSKYYYGYFGATTGTLMSSGGQPTPAPTPGFSLSDASTDADITDTYSGYTFESIGVQAKNSVTGLNFNDVDASFGLTFDDEGNMSAASFILTDGIYTADITTYTDNITTSDTRIYGTLAIDSTHQGENSNFWVSRSFNDSLDEADDFVSEYMVSVIWDSATDNKGYLVAGFETDNIPTTIGTVIFDGNGEGVYKGTTDTYGVDFDVAAAVDFSARTLALATNNTHYTAYDSNTNTSETVLLNELNISNATLSYASNTNSISNPNFAAITANSVQLIASAGDINARFYGTNDNSAEEIGGTFNFSNGDNSNYYYGFFGATSATNSGGGGTPPVETPDENFVIAPVPAPKPADPESAPALNTLGYVSFDAARLANIDDEATKKLSLSGSAMQLYNASSYTRPDNNAEWTKISESITVSTVASPVLLATFDSYKHVYDTVNYNQYVYNEARDLYIYNEYVDYDYNTGENIYHEYVLDTDANPNYLDNVTTSSYLSKATIYVGGNSYTADTDDRESYRDGSSIYGGGVSVNGSFPDNNYNYQDENDVSNSFSAAYMKRITWHDNSDDLPENATSGTRDNYQGNMVAGFATASLPTGTETVTFTGIGGGNYSGYPPENDNNGYSSFGFDVTAIADFDNLSVVLTTTNTKGCVWMENDENCTDYDLSKLNFTSTLSYTAGDNNLSGVASADGMSGNVNARFYGPIRKNLVVYLAW